ncbi:hypothetical protein KC906_03210, partial [Candidatus Kaiserbacteria bacterium]|nr:hypothetical protein [Candidatus Kaiserbacteria bacterium]
GPISELDQRFEIGAIRAVGGESLSSDDVSVVFERPNFDARFFRAPGDQIDAPSIEIDVARRGMSGTECGSHYRTIEITRTGQIALLDCPE